MNETKKKNNKRFNVKISNDTANTFYYDLRAWCQEHFGPTWQPIDGKKTLVWTRRYTYGRVKNGNIVWNRGNEKVKYSFLREQDALFFALKWTGGQGVQED